MVDADFYYALFKDILAIINSGGGDLPEEARAPVIEAFRVSYIAIAKEHERLMAETGAEFMRRPDDPVDRHKCAACFMLAVVSKLDMDAIERNILTPKLAKERLAIDIGLSLLLTLIKGDPCEEPGFIAFLLRNDNALALPDVLFDAGPYARDWAISLHHSLAGGGLHVLALSNTLFLIEAFNRERALRAAEPGPGFRQAH